MWSESQPHFVENLDFNLKIKSNYMASKQFDLRGSGHQDEYNKDFLLTIHKKEDVIPSNYHIEV